MATSIVNQIKAEIAAKQKEIDALQAALAVLDGDAKPAKAGKVAKVKEAKTPRKAWTPERKQRQAETLAKKKAAKLAAAA
jgi:hypothetical protein